MDLRKVTAWISFIFLTACVDPYRPPEVSNDLRLIVVDGFVSTTEGTIRVTLSRSNSPSVADVPAAESNAGVFVSSDAGEIYTLAEQDSGRYSLEGLTLDSHAKYQLHIQSQDGNKFMSEEVTAKESPPIDSITWRPAALGVNIYVNTHDPSGTAKYYSWDFVETWEYLSPITSYFKLVDHQVVQRSPEERIERCWRTLPSSQILVGTSNELQQDAIRDYLLIFIPKASNKISIRYSILVTQRSMSESEFEYYRQLHKTTENQGGLFDPLPSKVLGNIHQIDHPSTPVLGYFSAGAVRQQRIFIQHEDLPFALRSPRDLMLCTKDTVCIDKNFPQPGMQCPIDLAGLPESAIIVAPIYKGIGIIGYFQTTHQCVDCRVQGGVLTTPPFW